MITEAPNSAPARQISVIPLGGSGEFGLNTVVYECGNDIVVVDSGAMFPHEHQPGVGLIVPDISYLTSRLERVRGVILSHGHEDHTAGLHRLLRLVPVPVFGAALTLGLVRHRLREHGMLDRADLRVVKPDDELALGGFHVRFFRISHSIPDALAIVLRTDVGTILHAGEFKWDQSDSYNIPTDVQGLTDLGLEGVLLLVSDSTNADRPGTTPAEHELGPEIERIFTEAKGRVIVSAFASHLLRIQQFIDVATRHGRFIALAGRSLVQNVKIASELGYLDVPPSHLIELSQVSHTTPEKVAILCTGSQAETHAALALLARGEHRWLRVEPGDTVVISARVIPGNERAVSHMTSQLLRRGAQVCDASTTRVHVSGHGAQEDLSRMIHVVKPKFVLPIHGEYRNLVHHAEIAVRAGVPRERVVIAEDGERVQVAGESCSVTERIPAQPIMLAFDGQTEISEAALHTRQKLSRHGVCAAAVIVDGVTGLLAAPLRIAWVGVDLGSNAQTLIDQITTAVAKLLETRSAGSGADCADPLEESIGAVIGRVIAKRQGRRPAVLPIIVPSVRQCDTPAATS